MMKQTKKATCALCGYKSHILIPHLMNKHKADPLAYSEEHGALYSEYGAAKLRENAAVAAALPPRKRKTVTLASLFPGFESEDYSYEDDNYDICVSPGPHTPKANPMYVFPEQQTLDLLCMLEKKQRNNTYIQGFSGTGKTELATNILAKLNHEMMEINGDAYLTRGQLIGSWKVIGGETVFVYGPVPTAMRNGYTLVINEYDTLNPLAVNILKPIFEDNPRITIMENGREVIEAHPDFRVIVTANTWARGDDTGMFGNTHTQSIADQRRFNGFIELNYLPKEVEAKILKGYFPDLGDKAINSFIQVANKIRDSFKAGKIGRTFSPAELVNWAENFGFAQDVHHAARLSFLTAYEPEVRVAVQEYISSVFGHEDKA